MITALAPIRANAHILPKPPDTADIDFDDIILKSPKNIKADPKYSDHLPTNAFPSM